MLEAGNGSGVLWTLGSDHQTLSPVSSVTLCREDRSPLLFIHGVEFCGPEEAVRDFVNPMLQALGSARTMDRAIYIFSWNSLITNRLRLSEIITGTGFQRIKILMREMSKCRSYLTDVERRAKEAARALVPFAVACNADHRVGPTVITHSMGSLVWAETLKLMLESSESLRNPGIWWSLQPAMARNSFSEGGDYQAIPSIYTGRKSAKAMIWYSRMDYVLSSLYLVSKRCIALGHWGHSGSNIPQRDVTKWALEAHGMQSMSSKSGHFFQRVASILPAEADALGF
jgi:hypothetical protein